MATCEKCGHDIQIGEFPFCKGNPADHGPMTCAEDPIDYWDENLLPDPVHITSRAQRRKIMDAQGLDYKRKLEAPPGARVFIDMGRR